MEEYGAVSYIDLVAFHVAKTQQLVESEIRHVVDRVGLALCIAGLHKLLRRPHADVSQEIHALVGFQDAVGGFGEWLRLDFNPKFVLRTLTMVSYQIIGISDKECLPSFARSDGSIPHKGLGRVRQ